MLYVAVITLCVKEGIGNEFPGSLNMVKSTIISVSEEDYIEDKYPLTKREKAILENLFKGLQYKEIAVKLYISVETVKCHVKNIYTKLNVNNRSEAMIEYLKFIK
jgi:DNA-binding NarL/FixJ family response regulator